MKSMFALAILLAGAGLGMAEEGRVERGALAEMGLAALTEMSDVDGQHIRGQGGSFTYGRSISASAVPGSFSVNDAIAVGQNSSFATTGAVSAGSYNVYLLPPMSAFAGARGFAFATR